MDVLNSDPVITTTSGVHHRRQVHAQYNVMNRFWWYNQRCVYGYNSGRPAVSAVSSPAHPTSSTTRTPVPHPSSISQCHPAVNSDAQMCLLNGVYNNASGFSDFGFNSAYDFHQQQQPFFPYKSNNQLLPPMVTDVNGGFLIRRTSQDRVTPGHSDK